MPKKKEEVKELQEEPFLEPQEQAQEPEPEPVQEIDTLKEIQDVLETLLSSVRTALETAKWVEVELMNLYGEIRKRKQG